MSTYMNPRTDDCVERIFHISYWQAAWEDVTSDTHTCIYNPVNMEQPGQRYSFRISGLPTEFVECCDQ